MNRAVRVRFFLFLYKRKEIREWRYCKYEKKYFHDRRLQGSRCECHL